jgi:hypothetical protein
VPLVLFGVKNILIAASISYFLMFIYSLVIILKKPMFKIEVESYYQRFHYIPNIFTGIINQNYIVVLGRLLDVLNVVPVLSFYQKLFGLVVWPVALFLQKKIPELSGLIRTNNFELFTMFKSIYLVTIGIFSVGMLMLIILIILFRTPYSPIIVKCNTQCLHQ